MKEPQASGNGHGSPGGRRRQNHEAAEAHLCTVTVGASRGKGESQGTEPSTDQEPSEPRALNSQQPYTDMDAHMSACASAQNPSRARGGARSLAGVRTGLPAEFQAREG